MSTICLKFSIYFAVCLTFLLSSAASAQPQFRARIKIGATASSSAEFSIDGEFASGGERQSSRNWSFAASAGSAENLGERISDFDLSDRDGRKVAVKKFAASEYLADGEAARWFYKIDLSAAQNSNASAHASWLRSERGILMLGDLLPQFSAPEGKPISAQIEFDLPKDWRIITTETKTAENVFTVENVETAIFLVGKNWRTNEFAVGKSDLNLALAGDWQFSDDEARDIAREIYGEYEKVFGEAAGDRIQIALAPFPGSEKFGRWTAETRGVNLTILSADKPFKAQSLQLLHEQMRHELFHLWIPNRLALSGDYKWFYEGFAVYQALKTGVAVNRIRFEDFLATLAEAYDSDNREASSISPIEASNNRRSGNQIYARGMLIAFLCDAAILEASRGRRSVSDLLTEIYQKHRASNQAPPQNGSRAILEIFKRRAELNRIVEKYIKGAEKIDLETDLAAIGIEAIRENSFIKLKVKEKPSGRQKDLLNRLGYNNWRKLSEKQK